ncbi:hypothetical protein DH2020_037200 [Rehmannia glutinosa]|uniref:TF-B3 domain-containing protein n=1 Tax=Rehmannia glutinosa TaxID=99300 RepID=A0ABR0V4N5_REHGL
MRGLFTVLRELSKKIFARPKKQLPPEFIRKYGKIIPENTKLRTSSRETWNVELEKIDEENFWFTRGWTKFAKDVGVKLGEFLVFWFDIGKSTFDVSIYGPTGCERQISACISPVEGSDSFNRTCINLNTPGFDPMSAHVPPCAVRTLRKEFAVAAGLTTKEAVVLQYSPKQRCWPVMLHRDPKVSWFRLHICRGWSEFKEQMV